MEINRRLFPELTIRKSKYDNFYLWLQVNYFTGAYKKNDSGIISCFRRWISSKIKLPHYLSWRSAELHENIRDRFFLSVNRYSNGS